MSEVLLATKGKLNNFKHQKISKKVNTQDTNWETQQYICDMKRATKTQKLKQRVHGNRTNNGKTKTGISQDRKHDQFYT